MTNVRVVEWVPLRPSAIEAIVGRWPSPGALIRELRTMSLAALRFEIAVMIGREYDEDFDEWFSVQIGQDQMIAIQLFVFRGLPQGIRELLRHYGESLLLPATVI